MCKILYILSNNLLTNNLFNNFNYKTHKIYSKMDDIISHYFGLFFQIIVSKNRIGIKNLYAFVEY